MNWIWRSIIGAVIFSASTALAGGWEKATMYSGQWAGLGGANVSAIEGAQALTSNPAGLLSSRDTKQEIAFEISPTSLNGSAPATGDGTSNSIKNIIAPIPALFYDYKLADNLALGAGVDVLAASDLEYDNLSFSGLNGSGTDKIQYTFYELSLGAGYKIMDGLTVGAAWHATLYNLSLDEFIAPGGGVTEQTNMDGLSQTAFDGFRLGVQYAPSKTWGIGVGYRAPTHFKLTGSGAFTVPGVTSGSITNIEMTSEIPAEISIGGNCSAVEQWKFYAQYDWLNYAAINQLGLSGSAGGTALSPVNTYWNDQNRIRLGAEWDKFDWPMRFGYTYNTATTPSGDASPLFFPPGSGNTLAVGTGHLFMDGTLKFDSAFEYGWQSGSGAAPAMTGTYSLSTMALHLGLSYFM